MRLATAAAVFIGVLAAITALPSLGAAPAKAPLSVSITSGPANPTTSTGASFAFTFGGSPTSTECRESSGVGDRFTRLGGLGTAEAGGAWLSTGGFSTDGQRATVPATAGVTKVASLGTAWTDADVSARVSLGAVPAKDQASGLIAARVSGGDSFSGRLTVLAGGQIRLQLVRSSLGVETVLGTFGLGSKYAAGNVFWIRLQTSGTTVRAKGWADGKPEPDWQLSVVDATPMTGTLVAFGSRGGSGLTNAVTVAVDDFMAWSTTAAATVTPCPGGSASYTALGVGGHVFRVRASASSSQVNGIYPWTVNTVAPTVSLTSTPANPTTSTDATFAWTTTGMVDSTTCTLDGTSAACSSPKSYSNLAVGQHSFSVSVSNAGGSNSASVSWTINPPAPTVTLSSTPTDPTTSTDASFSWTTTGTVDSTTCTLDGSAAACTSPKAYSGLATGQHSFSVQVSNAGGSDSASFTWTINPPAPTVSLTSTPTDPTTSTDASFSWTTTGTVDSTTCTLDGSSAACTSPKSYVNLSVGQHSFSVQVSNAGGSASATHSWTSLPPPPTVRLTAWPEMGTTETTATFEWTTTGQVGATYCELDTEEPPPPPGFSARRSADAQSEGLSPCSSPITYTDLAPGPHIFKVTVTNAGGSAEASYIWRISEPTPTVTITSGPSDGTFSTSGTFTFAVSDPSAAVSCELDASTANIDSCDTASAAVSGLQPGAHTFTVSAENSTGIGSASYSWNIGLPGADLIPIALRSTEFASAAAVFYDEATGSILSVSPFCETPSIAGLPPDLEGWSLCAPAYTVIAPTTGIVIAVSQGQLQISGYTVIDQLCQQDLATLRCFNAPGVSVESGLQFIRGYAEGTVTNGPPAIRSAWLNGLGGCASYFNATATACQAVLEARIDLGGVLPSNVEASYLVAADSGGSSLTPGGLTYVGGDGWVTQSNPLQFAAGSRRNSIAIRIRVRNATVGGVNCGTSFSTRCQWFHTGSGVSTSEPSSSQILDSPIQRSFMGDDASSGPIKFLRLAADVNCDGYPDSFDGQAASQTLGSPHCFSLEMGTKVLSAAQSQDDPGAGFVVDFRQAATIDCDQGVVTRDEIVNGCVTTYAPYTFGASPPCPDPAYFFSSTPPLTCVLAQAGYSPGALNQAFNLRMFNTSTSLMCPTDAPGFVRGRNYWSNDNNSDDTWTFPNLNPEDPRIVRLATAPASFSGSGTQTLPIVSIVRFYITGWGVKGSGPISVSDPCPGNTIPSDLIASSGGFYFWGHVLP